MRRVLIIEDDPIASDVLARLLHRRGIDSENAATLAKGLACYAKGAGEFHCVVLDANLPDSSALETAHRIPEFGDCPVVVITADEDPELVKSVRARGASLLIKPSDPNLIMRTVWSQIEYRNPGEDAETGFLDSDREIHRSVTSSRVPLYSLALAIAMGAATLGGSLYRSISDQARQSTQVDHRIDVAEKRLDDLEFRGKGRDSKIEELRQQAQARVDDSAAIKQRADHFETEIYQRLDRIERKLDNMRPGL